MFQICGALDPAEDFDENLLNKATSTEDVIHQIKAKITDMGRFGIRGLNQLFYKMDEHHCKI